ncbi:MAG: RNA polymerase sigma factor [Mucilaginibacter polytrichastri]|nr:RNA polymerase sigma factor [Mucilaginibacter polytrichastri]
MTVQPGDSRETELIRLCKRNKAGAQEKLYTRYFGYAMGVGLRYCINRDDALEVVNDAFIKIFGAIQSFDEALPFKPWLRRIVINCSIDQRRKNQRLLYTEDIETADAVAINISAIDKLQMDDLLKMLDMLPEMLRTVFNLVEVDGYSHEEIAKMIGIPASSSRVYLSRAKDRLRAMLTNPNNAWYGRVS